MMSPVGHTSRWVAAGRALETESPNPLFKDPYARPLAGEEGFSFLAESQKIWSAPPDSPNAYLSIRTRFLDDALLAAIEEGRLQQVVILAAGMDSRAFRLAWPDGITLFEIDRDEIFDHKEKILAGFGANPACERKIVRADLEHDWVGPLVQAGFDPKKPTAFLVEGLLVYLEDAAVDKILSTIRSIACPGSWLGMDMPGTEILESPFFTAHLEKLEELGCPWIFGVSDPEQFLARYGWAGKVVCVGEPEANFGRWPFPVVPRSVPGVPRSYLISAWREKA